MAIIQEIDESLFIQMFENYKRVGENKNFSYKGLRALFEYLWDYTEDTEQDFKLDVISLCVDFSEYKNLDEYLNDTYTTEEINEIWDETDNDLKEGFSLEEKRKQFKENMENEISEKTTLIKFEDDLDEGFIIQSY